MNSLFVLINNDLLAWEDARLHIADLSFQRGYGIFDFFKVVNGRPVFLEDHLDRFYYSAEAMRLTPVPERKALAEQLGRLMAANQLPESGIRLTLTGGFSPDGYTPVTPNLVITQQPLQLAREVSSTGIAVITHAHQRQLPHIKSIDYLMAVWLQPVVKSSAAQDVLYHNHGFITECPRSNIFIVNQAGELVTPGKHVLHGITRKKVLELAEGMLPIVEREIHLEELMQAREAFITSTTKHILPVCSVDGMAIGDGQPGPVAQALGNALLNLVFGTEG